MGIHPGHEHYVHEDGVPAYDRTLWQPCGACYGGCYEYVGCCDNPRCGQCGGSNQRQLDCGAGSLYRSEV
jgi:hypothetical protein